MPLVGDMLAGYRLLAVLGRGGMSVVFQAENPRIGSVVALKVLAPELATNDLFRARFLQESRIAASLNHPNVIPIFDMGTDEDLLYIAMRYIAGSDLRSILRTRKHLVPEEALYLVGQTGRALDFAHRHGLVHRDVKPANVLIERGVDEDDPDHVYLADFGITKHALSRTGLTPTGQFMGTIDYIAPEQIQGRSVDGRADVYSLSCVLYEALTGQVPFVKEADAAIIWAHVEEDAPPPSTLQTQLPVAFDDVIAKALSKNPNDRYQTCRALVEDARGAFHNPDTSHTTVLGTVRASAPVAEPAREPASEPASEPAREPARPPAGPSAAPAAGTSPDDASPSPEPTPPAAPPSASPRGTGGHESPGSGGHRSQVLIAAAFAVLLVLAGGGVWFGVRGRASSAQNSATGDPAMSPSAAMTGSTMPTPSSGASPAKPHPLMKALTDANTGTGGLLPPAACTEQSPTQVICGNPAFAVTSVEFQTFDSLPTLYGQYMQRVREISGKPIRPNTADCSLASLEGETSWTHDFKHTRKYSLAQSASGKLTDEQGAGRLFCTFSHNYLTIVWTENDGNLLATVTGHPHSGTYKWWRRIHHEIAIDTGNPMTRM